MCMVTHYNLCNTVIPELFSIENGYLTPTFKIKRNEVKAAFKEQLANLYDDIQTMGASGISDTKSKL